MRTDANGKGVINILSAEKLFRCRNCTPPACCGCFQSCMNIAGSGRSGETKTGVFLRRSALLFNDAPQVLLDKIEQVIRLFAQKAWASGSFRKTRQISR